MKFLVLTGLFLSLIFMTEIEGRICFENFCESVKCEVVTKSDCDGPGQYIKKNGSECRCCDICYTNIPSGGKCNGTVTIGGPPPTSGCGPHLICIHSTCIWGFFK